MNEAENWLQNEDRLCYQDRLDRLEWIAVQTPKNENWLFHGGLMTKFLFEEVRYSFVYGQYLAAIILGLSFIEHSLANLFYAAGKDDMERASVSLLTKKALKQNLISEDEVQELERIRKFRNSITHFRQPGSEDRIEFMMLLEDKYTYEIIEEEARFVMNIVMRFLGKFSEIV